MMAWLESHGLLKKMEEPDHTIVANVYRPAFDHVSWWYGPNQTRRRMEQGLDPQAVAVDTPAMRDEMEKLHFRRLHPRFFGADLEALLRELKDDAEAAASSPISTPGQAASSTSPLSHVPPTPYTPRIPQDKLGNQGMKLPAQTAAEWVVESVEVAHIVRKDGIQEVSAISSPHRMPLT